MMDSIEHKVFLYHCLFFIHFGEHALYPFHKFKEAKEEIFNQTYLLGSQKKANVHTAARKILDFCRESNLKNLHVA